MIIDCDQIINESDRLRNYFVKCRELKASDMRDIVDLIESVSICSGASLQFKTINGESIIGTGNIEIESGVSTTKIIAGTNISVTGDGSDTNKFVITNTAPIPDGSETKVVGGLNVIVNGNGTTSSPYAINVNLPSFSQVNSDWAAVSGPAFILNKPIIPNAQVNADWNATSGISMILNKPNLASTNLGYIASNNQGEVTSSNGDSAILPIANNINAGLLSPEMLNNINLSSDNIKTELTIQIPSGFSNQDFVDVINELTTFEVQANEILTFKSIRVINENLSYIYYVEMLNVGKGEYGTGGHQLLSTEVKVTSFVLTSNELESDETTQIIDLGTNSGNILDTINTQIPNIVIQNQSEGYVLIKGTFDGNYQEFLWLGIGGVYGGESGALQAVSSDLTEITKSGNSLRATSTLSGTVRTDLTVSDPQVYLKQTSDSLLSLKAPLDSPVFTGNPTGPVPTTEFSLVTKGYADSLIVGMLNLRGSWDASSNLYPTTGGSGTYGAIRKGDLWYVSVAGILSGKSVNAGDSFAALVNTPGQTFSNWNVMESNIGYVPEDVNNKQNSLTIDGTGNKYPTVDAVNLGFANTPTKIHHLTHEDGGSDMIVGTNLSIVQSPINYAISAPTLGAHLFGIDTRFGQISSTSAGITQRVYFTADNTIITAGTFFASSALGKGSTASGNPTALVLGDNVKAFFNKDIISIPKPATTIGYAGTYSGNLTVSASPTPNATQQRFTIEVYRTNNGGTPIASGVSGAPTGDLGVTVVSILDSGIINLTAGAISNVPVSGILTQNITLNTGERLRYHVSAQKIGTGGGNVTFNSYYGNSHNSYYDTAVAVTTDAVVNKSLVAGITATDALNTLNTLKESVSNKQNSLIADGSGVKFPTVDATSLGLDSKNGVYFPMPFIDNFKTESKSTNILVIGDSNYADPDRMMWAFLRNLNKYKKTNGIGFFSLNLTAQTMGINVPVYTGTWTDRNIFTGGYGMDGKSIFSNTLTSSITITPENITIPNIGFANEIKVLYRKNLAGTLEIATDGVTFTDYVLSTSVVGDLGVITIPITLSNSWNLRLRLKTGQVELVGAIASNNAIGGIKLHKSASSGASSADFSTLSNTNLWKQNVALVNPDIVFIGLTTNDVNQGLSTASIKSNLTTIFNNIRLVNKNCAIFFVIPPRNNYTLIPVTATTYDDNSRAINDLAITLGAGTVPLFEVWNKYPKDYTDTLFNDGIHYNTAGAYINSELLSKYISLSSANGVQGQGQTNVIPKFKDGFLVDSNIFNDGVKIGFGTSVPSGEFSFKNQIILDGGNLLWGVSAPNGILSWDTGKAIIKARSGNILALGANDGEQLTISTGGVIKSTNLAGAGTRQVVVSASGDLSATDSAPTSGTYTPTVTASTNVTSTTLSNASYTKIGNIVTGTISINMQATAINLLSEITFTVPVNRASVVPNYYVGAGTYQTDTAFSSGNGFFSGSSATTITLRFNSGESVASAGSLVFTFQYDITK